MTTRRPEHRLHLHPATQTLKRLLLPLLILLSFLGPAPGVAQGQDPDETMVMPGSELVIRAADYSQDVTVPPPGAAMRLSPHASLLAAINVTCNNCPPEVEAAFQYALGIWEGLLDSPVDIDVEANWTPLGSATGILGSSMASRYVRNFAGAPAANTWFADALADRRACGDLEPSETFEILTEFNSEFPDWYLGTDGNPPEGQWDFVTVVLHEIGHGLGIAGVNTTIIGSRGYWDSSLSGTPSIYTRFMSDGYGVPITSYANRSSELAVALEGGEGGIRATGIHAIAGNGGLQPVMYSPATWSQGSSYSHFNQTTYAVELMRPFLPDQTAIHNPGTRTLGILRDIGWGDELVIQAFGYNTSDSRPEWVQIQNHSSITITLSDYAIGDEEDQGSGGEGMFLLPAVDLAPGDLFTMRVRGSDGPWDYSAPDPTYCWNCVGDEYTNLVNYSPWGGTAGNLDDAGDEVVLLRTNGGVADPDGTIDDFIIDAICYGSGQDYVDTDGDGSMDGRDKEIFEGGGCLTDLVSGSYYRADTVENCVPASAHADNPTAITIASTEASQTVAADGRALGVWPLLLALSATLGAWFVFRRRIA